jgi:membrane fusion protein, macrolide-specific efflux system
MTVALLATVLLGIVLIFRMRDSGGRQSGITPVASVDVVKVERADIADVVTLTGRTVARPRYSVLAEVAGVVSHASRVKPGTNLRVGSEVFRQQGRGTRIPVAGTFASWESPTGDFVESSVPVASVTMSGFAVAAALPPELAYRLLSGPLTGRAQIVNGPGPFRCTVVYGVKGVKRAEAELLGPPGPPILCAIPASVRCFADLRVDLALSSAIRRQVLTLPLSAVAGSIDRGQVSVVGSDGRAIVRTVSLGVSDGALVEIKAGLHEGESVLATAPNVASNG